MSVLLPISRTRTRHRSVFDYSYLFPMNWQYSMHPQSDPLLHLRILLWPFFSNFFENHVNLTFLWGSLATTLLISLLPEFVDSILQVSIVYEISSLLNVHSISRNATEDSCFLNYLPSSLPAYVIRFTFPVCMLQLKKTDLNLGCPLCPNQQAFPLSLSLP